MTSGVGVICGVGSAVATGVGSAVTSGVGVICGVGSAVISGTPAVVAVGAAVCPPLYSPA